MRLLFFRCPHGHWFRRQACPFDGWTHPDIVKAEQQFTDGPAMHLDVLVAQGIPGELVQRMLIIESAFIPESMEGDQLEIMYSGWSR
jgi:hypothetical protein